MQYIHKVRGNRNVYLFSNLGSAPVDTFAKLRGKQIPQLWDPHTGAIIAMPEYSLIRENGQEVTRIRLSLGRIRSVFAVSSNAAN